jgi:hypothetical protein
MEAVRPLVDSYVLALLTQRTLSANDFVETRQGACRLMPRLAGELAGTLSAWRHHVAPIVEQTAHAPRRQHHCTAAAAYAAHPSEPARGTGQARAEPPPTRACWNDTRASRELPRLRRCGPRPASPLLRGVYRGARGAARRSRPPDRTDRSCRAPGRATRSCPWRARRPSPGVQERCAPASCPRLDGGASGPCRLHGRDSPWTTCALGPRSDGRDGPLTALLLADSIG